jgi:hypothetical protein
MKIEELLPIFDEEIRTLNTGGEESSSLVEGEILLVPNLDDHEVIIKQGKVYEAYPFAEKDSWVYTVDNYIWYLKKTSGKQITLLSLKTQPVDEIFEGMIAIGVDEKVRDEVAKKAGFNNPSIEEVASWLNDEFILEGESGDRTLIARYRNHSSIPDKTVNFIGRNFLLELEVSPDKSVWIKRISPFTRNKKYSVSVINQPLEFCDVTVAASLANPEEIEKLESLRRDQSSYIVLWEEYNRLEDIQAENEARATGYVRYKKVKTELTVDGSVEWRFHFDKENQASARKLFEALKQLDSSQVEISKDLPEWLNADTSSAVSFETEGGEKTKGKLLSLNDRFLVIELEKGKKPTEDGVIYFSLAGQQVMSSRRSEARDKINRRTNGMPQLGHLIEGLPFKQPEYKPIDLKKLGAKKYFKNTPTEKQLEALHVALNTPDIALILGPPGTGKTQIISALQKILAKDGSNSTSKEFLVSSFQHDAVDNVVDRSDVFGLPAIRVGKKGSSDAIQRWVTRQESGITEIIKRERSESSLYALVTEIRQDIAALLIGRLSRQEYKGKILRLSKLLGKLRGEHSVSLPATLMVDLDIAIKSLTEKENRNTSLSESSAVRQVRALRTAKCSYEDDGAERVFDCVQVIRKLDIIQVEELDFLEELSDSFDTPSDDSFKRLNRIKDKLLLELMPDPRPLSLQLAVGKDFSSLLKRISESLSVEMGNTVAGIDDVLGDYLSTLKYQRDRVQSSLEKYTTTLGATCQGAVTPGMLNIMSEAGRDGITFDTVIIDEAARANPLDLFIPMSLARRRIVLVGDHYQLPQLLEPDIENEMKESGVLKDSYSNALKDSLFQRLYNQLKVQTDGFPRTVMLDKQFRMHPLIGEFVSQNFYEKEGEKPIQPGLDISAFDLDLNKSNASIANWVDVPNSLGKEKHFGTSWQRQAEVDKTAALLDKLLKTYPESSIGVITFHAPQRDLIFDALQKKGICRRGEESWEYEEDFISTPDGQERIRVGTVDSFQGKEFDIVILSMTRSNLHRGETEDAWNRKFGFLRLPNRLNVAFSRVRNALFVIGDRAMFLSAEAKSAIPSVYTYASEVSRDYL